MRRIAFAVLFLCSVVPVFAANTRSFVSSSGIDTDPCTRSNPCRSFAAAMAATNPGGEVVVLDSAGYGTMTITQAVTIVAPLGVHAGITATSGVAVAVNAGAGDAVALKNLFMNSQGASTGISYIAGLSLHIDHCTVNGFLGNNIELVPPGGGSVNVDDTNSRNAGQSGIYASGTSSAVKVFVDHSRFEQNQFGFVADYASVHIADSVADGNTQYGFWARGGSVAASMVIDRSAVSHSNNAVAAGAACYLLAQNVSCSGAVIGFLSQAGTLSIQACLVGGSTVGVQANGATGTATVTDSTFSTNAVGVQINSNASGILTGCTITKNTTGVSATGGGIVYSAGDNVITANTNASSTLTPVTKM